MEGRGSEIPIALPQTNICVHPQETEAGRNRMKIMSKILQHIAKRPKLTGDSFQAS